MHSEETNQAGEIILFGLIGSGWAADAGAVMAFASGLRLPG